MMALLIKNTALCLALMIGQGKRTIQFHDQRAPDVDIDD